MSTLAIIITALVVTFILGFIYERLLADANRYGAELQLTVEDLSDENAKLVHTISEHIESRMNDITVFVSKPAPSNVQSILDEDAGQYELPFNVIPFQRTALGE